MKPAPLEHRPVTSIAEAVGALGQWGDEAKVLAGGQSLVPLLNLRLARVGILVDIDRVPGLSYLVDDGDALRIGALTRHRQIERRRDLEGLSVLSRAATWIGHYPIRTRGTIGGSLAHADPTAEWCLLAVLLDAEIVAEGPAGRRTIPAGDFFRGFLTTALEPDEVLVEVRFGRRPGHAELREFARRRGDFAIVVAGVAYDVVAGRIADPRVVVGGVGPSCARLPEVEDLLGGEPPADGLFREAGALAARLVQPTGDAHGDERYRRWLTGGLVHEAASATTGSGQGADAVG